MARRAVVLAVALAVAAATGAGVARRAVPVAAPVAGVTSDRAVPDGTPAPPSASEQVVAALTPRPSSRPTPTPTPSPSPSPSCRPAPLAERAAQVLVVGLPGVTDPDDPLAAELDALGVGGVLLTKTNVETASQVRGLVGALRRDAEHGLLIATDEEPGRVSSFGELIGRTSSARTLAARGTPGEVRALGREMGSALAGFGVDLDLAPVADLDDGPAGGIVGDRAFSAEADEASAYALAFARGLGDAGVLAAVKHFPGHGRSATDSHAELDLVEVDLDELLATDAAPFADAIDAGVPVVLFAHVAYSPFTDSLPASLDPAAYDFLRDDLGFTGVAMTDSLGMGAVNLRWAFPEAAVRAVHAGADALLATDGAQARAMRDALVVAVRSGRIPESRLDEAAARVLALKGEDPRALTCRDEDVPSLTGLRRTPTSRP